MGACRSGYTRSVGCDTSASAVQRFDWIEAPVQQSPRGAVFVAEEDVYG